MTYAERAEKRARAIYEAAFFSTLMQQESAAAAESEDKFDFDVTLRETLVRMVAKELRIGGEGSPRSLALGRPPLRDLSNPHPAFRALAIAERAAGRQRYPIERVAHHQLGAGRAGVELRVADRAEAIFSCLTPVVALQRWSITTVEGLGTERTPSPLQRALSRSRRRSAAIAPPA